MTSRCAQMGSTSQAGNDGSVDEWGGGSKEEPVLSTMPRFLPGSPGSPPVGRMGRRGSPVRTGRYPRPAVRRPAGSGPQKHVWEHGCGGGSRREFLAYRCQIKKSGEGETERRKEEEGKGGRWGHRVEEIAEAAAGRPGRAGKEAGGGDQEPFGRRVVSLRSVAGTRETGPRCVTGFV